MSDDARDKRHDKRPRLPGRLPPRSLVAQPRAAGARSGPGRGSRLVAMLDLVFPSLPWEARAFLASLATYHVSEYAIAWAYNRPLLSRDSWLLSTPYCVAMLAGCAEYALELALGFDASRRLESVRLLGLAMVVAGDALRKTAEITARHNFTHKIMTRRRAEHVVVRRGVYRHVRHPGYLGWFVWSVGTQVLLCNPACVVAFTVAAWRFFADRIPVEEEHLRRMFPGEYAAYAAVTPTWIPGIP